MQGQWGAKKSAFLGGIDPSAMLRATKILAIFGRFFLTFVGMFGPAVWGFVEAHIEGRPEAEKVEQWNS